MPTLLPNITSLDDQVSQDDYQEVLLILILIYFVFNKKILLTSGFKKLLFLICEEREREREFCDTQIYFTHKLIIRAKVGNIRDKKPFQSPTIYVYIIAESA